MTQRRFSFGRGAMSPAPDEFERVDLDALGAVEILGNDPLTDDLYMKVTQDTPTSDEFGEEDAPGRDEFGGIIGLLWLDADDGKSYVHLVAADWNRFWAFPSATAAREAFERFRSAGDAALDRWFDD